MGKHNRTTLGGEIEKLKTRLSTIELNLGIPPFLPPIPVETKQEVVVPDNHPVVEVWFDAGMKHGITGYGSYQVAFDGQFDHIVRLELYDAASSNHAELMALNSALTYVYHTCPARPWNTRLIVYGDSQLALFTSSGKWKAKHPNVKPTAINNRSIMESFKRFSVQWVPREEMVARFGH